MGNKIQLSMNNFDFPKRQALIRMAKIIILQV